MRPDRIWRSPDAILVIPEILHFVKVRQQPS
jgi:hypothetical protein